MPGQNEEGKSLVAGLDLGGTKLAAALFRVNKNGEVSLERDLENKKYREIFEGIDPSDLTSEGKSRLIEEAMVGSVKELASGMEGDIRAIGICSAGFVENGYIIEAWNTGMKNYPLRDRIAERTGYKTYLYKDSWAPVYALRPAESSIIFSIGTGFGGVSCEPDLTIPLRSYTARRRPKWIPFLYANDDPGYAVSFSEELSAEIIFRGLEKARREKPGLGIPGGDAVAEEWARKLKESAKKEKRLSPSKIELLLAKALAGKAVGRMHPDEIYADFACASTMPPLLYSWMTNQVMTPQGLDEHLIKNTPAAAAAFYVQAEFIGYILYKMQEERIEAGLKPAGCVYATGSGYNEVTHRAMSRPAASAMSHYCRNKMLKIPPVEAVELIQPKNIPTTFACLGAGLGRGEGYSIVVTL